MLKEPSLFISLQFPFTDLRPFVPEETHRLSFPNWPIARPERREFVRLTGAVRARWSGGDEDWAGEETYSNARSALLFQNFLGRRFFGSEKSLRAICCFRRFFSNGVIARFELGLEFRGCGELIPHLQGSAFLGLLKEILSVEAGVLREDWTRVKVPLTEAGPLLASHFLRATTRRVDKKLPQTQPWWFTAGQPLLLMEYRPINLVEIPDSCRMATPVSNQDFTLHHEWLRVGKQTLGAWFLGGSANSEKDRLRRLRIHLFRLHAERQGLLEILRQIVPHQLAANDSGSAVALWNHLQDGTDLLQRKQRYGVDQSELLKAAQGFVDQMSPGERITLLREIESLQRSARRVMEKRSDINIQGISAGRDVIIAIAGEINNSFGRGTQEATPLAV